MFRPLLPLVLACFLVILPFTDVHAASLGQNAQGYQGEVNTTANIRSGPGLTFPVINQMQPGQIIITVACNADCSWLQLATGGWIAAFLVDVVALPAPSQPATTATVTQPTTEQAPSVEQVPVQQPPVVTQPAQSPTVVQPAQQSTTTEQPAQQPPVVTQPDTPIVPSEPQGGVRRSQVIDPDKLELHAPSEAAQAIVTQILSFTGLPQNFELYSANIYNAAALMVKGRRVIVYDPQLIADIENVTHRDRAAVSIFAHEIGHHLAGHTLAAEYNKEYELQADYFSGFILQKMGATLEDAQAVMEVLPDHANMVNHPPQAERLVAIENGWRESERQDGLAAWQPTFPSFDEEVALDSQDGAMPAGGAILLDALRQAQDQQLAAGKAVVAVPAHDWSLGLRALAGVE